MSSVVKRKWSYDGEFLHKEKKAIFDAKKPERQWRYRNHFVFKTSIKIGDVVYDDMNQLVNKFCFHKETDIPDNASVRISFAKIRMPYEGGWTYDEFMIGMSDYGFECVDWFVVCKVMHERVLKMLENGEVHYDEDGRYFRYGINKYPSYAECESFEWFIHKYTIYLLLKK